MCLNEKVAGFTQRMGEIGDTIYFTVKIKKEEESSESTLEDIVCGGRGVLREITDYKPWKDSERYVQAFALSNVEFCSPFSISFLKEIGGKGWYLKYIQRSKSIKDQNVIDLLNNSFQANKSNQIHVFNKGEFQTEQVFLDPEDTIDITTVEEQSNIDISDFRLDVMGTFRVIKFLNESDNYEGLEKLVTENFYQLFDHFNENNTILIPENRIFKTSSLQNSGGENVTGVRGIPDALLITYDINNIERKISPFQINLIEYECYGKNKSSSRQKSNYFVEHIIPQLIKFASTFSVVTDNKIRENTIDDWTNKIMEAIDNDDSNAKKVTRWIRELKPDIKERQINLTVKNYLTEAFKTNIRILLIIDELSIEQKDTIENMIKAFKLDNNVKGKDNSVNFKSYVVRLQQRINSYNNEGQFALSFEE